jgi:hypothetical protein
MYKRLKSVVDDIQSVTDLFNSLEQNGSLTFNEKLTLFELFLSLKDINSIIDAAERDAKRDPDRLLDNAYKMAECSYEAITKYFKVAKTLLAIDFEQDSKDCMESLRTGEPSYELCGKEKKVEMLAYFDPSMLIWTLAEIQKISASIRKDVESDKKGGRR